MLVAIIREVAPLEIVSLMLLMVLEDSSGIEIRLITGVLFSIRDMVPCFSSPAG